MLNVVISTRSNHKLLTYTQCKQWRNVRGSRGARRPPGRINVKYGPWLACISVFSIILVFSRFLLLAFFKNLSECIPVISGVSTDESS